jgi:hypothetical protein
MLLVIQAASPSHLLQRSAQPEAALHHYSCAIVLGLNEKPEFTNRFAF